MIGLDGPGFEGKKQMWCFFDWIQRSRRVGLCLLFLDLKEKNRCSVPSVGFERKTKCGVTPIFERKRNRCCVSSVGFERYKNKGMVF